MESFKTKFCKRFSCSEKDFPKILFRKCVFAHALPAVLLAETFCPDYLAIDYLLLQALGAAQDPKSVQVFARQIKFRYKKTECFSFARRYLRARISGRKLIRMASLLWEKELMGAEYPDSGINSSMIQLCLVVSSVTSMAPIEELSDLF